MRRARVAALPAAGAEFALDRDVSHHFAMVLRLQPGERVTLFDGVGGEVDAVVIDADKRGMRVVAEGPMRRCAPRQRVHLLLGQPKGPAMDLAVRMATEAGVTDLHPVLTCRAVPKGDKPERWERIAEAAAAQCGRADIPRVWPALPLVEALATVAHVPDRRVATPGAPDRTRAASDVAILVGPEGGLSEDEVALAIDHGFEAQGLGQWVLRASTAAAVAVAAVSAPWNADGS